MILCIGILVASFVLVLICVPQRIVQAQAILYGWIYRDVLGKSNEEIADIRILPTDRYLMSDMLVFIETGSRKPESFRRLVLAYRVLGIVMGSLILLTALLLLFERVTR